MSIPLSLPQVTRIPITGPAPYNTLVCVSAESLFGTQQVNPGQTSRWAFSVGTSFRLAGFDQRVPPRFEHSTLAFLGATGPGTDDEFQYAVDSVTGAGFDPVQGTYFVNVDVALLPPDPQSSTCFAFGETGICFYFPVIQICSFVLVNEPPIAVPGDRHRRAGLADRPQVAQRPTGASLAELLSSNLGLPGSAAVLPSCRPCNT